MNVQYISDSVGKTTGVFIPIDEWNELKERHKDIEENEAIPDWHKKIVLERMEDAKKNPETMLDWDDVVKSLRTS